MSLRTTILAAAAIVAGFVNISCATAPAYAQGQETIAVSYADLNLANQAGRAVLHERVADAAADLCGAFDRRDVGRAEAGRACISATLAAVQPQLDAAVGYRGTVQVAQNELTVRVVRAAN
ncbi:MAG TPA: UrcA family protein [Allosphingosinicella sp.]